VTRAPALRATALLALGAFAVHQARYALVPDAHGACAHGYLATAAPLALALLLTAALGRTLLALASGALRGRAWTWLGASGALLALHVVQEAGERLAAGGGPVDAGVLLVVPLCLLAGWLIALALRGSEALAEAPAAVAAPRARLLAAAVLVPAARAAATARTGVARHLAGRAPPSLV